MADFGTFDLARAYASAEDVQASQQARTLRDIQMRDALKPKEIDYDTAIGHARLALGAAHSVAADPSDENVRRQYDVLKRAGALTDEFDVNRMLKSKPESRVSGARQWIAQIEPFLTNASEPGQATKPESGISNVDPAKFTSESLGAYAKSVDPKTGIGNYDLLRLRPEVIAEMQQKGQGASPYGTFIYTPEGIMYGNNRTGDVGLAPGGGQVLRTADDPATRGAVTGAEEAAKLDAQRAQQIEVKIQGMDTMDSILDNASELARASTGSYIGAGVDQLARVFGFTPSGAEAIGALGVMSARLLENVPRMEGPQSDADRKVYEAAAGNLASSTTTVGVKMAAIRTIRALNAKYKLEQGGAATGAAPVRKYNPATGKIE